MPNYENLCNYGELYCNGIKIGQVAEVPVFTHTDKEDDETDFVMRLHNPETMSFTGTIDISNSRMWRKLKRWMRKVRQQAKRQVEKERKQKNG